MLAIEKDMQEDIDKLIQLGYIEAIYNNDGNLCYKVTHEGYEAYLDYIYYQEGKLN
jgi:hypothetical protein